MTAPIPAQHAIEISEASQGSIPAFRNSQPAITIASAVTEPTDRSIPPEIKRIVMPITMIPSTAKATDIARECVTRFGMTAEVGQAVLEDKPGQYLDQHGPMLTTRDYAEETAREIDLAVRELIEQAYEQAKSILSAHLADLKTGAALLLDRETITPEDFPPIARRPKIVAGAAIVDRAG